MNVMKVNFGRLLYQIAAANKDKLGLKNIERDREFTFMELHLLTNRICNMLHERFHLRENDYFILLMENDNLSLFNFWTAKGLSISTWLNYRDSMEEHFYQIDFLEPKLVFIETEKLPLYYNELKKRDISIVCMDQPTDEFPEAHYFWDIIKDASDEETGVEYDMDEHIVTAKFTGGTTGRGKCVRFSLRTILSGANYAFAHFENIIDDSTKFLHVTPLSHATQNFYLPSFLKGGTNYTINTTDLHLFCEVTDKEKITSSFMVPTLLYRLLDLSSELNYNLNSLRMISYGASPMSPSKLEQLQDKFGNIFCQIYGASEAYPLVVLLGLKDHIVRNEEDRKRISSSGRALPGVEIIIADEQGNEVPRGEKGEILIRCDAVVKEYYKDPENTAASFMNNGFWKSGDVGYMDEKGFIYLVDRKKDMIISGGFNVYASEVEHALNSHPAVQQSAVVGIPHEEWGEAVHAEIILRENQIINKEELIQFCKTKIASYKLPKTINFVKELPTSGVGKVLRRKVREKYWADQVRNVN